jgi:hypothetical protein
MSDDKSKEAQRKRAEMVRDLGLRDAYPRDHSPSGVFQRRVVWNETKGHYELEPEARHAEKPKRSPDDSRHVNLRKPKGEP